MKIFRIIKDTIIQVIIDMFCKKPTPLKVEIIGVGHLYYIRRNGIIVESSKTDNYMTAQQNYQIVIDFENPRILLTNATT